MAELLVGLLDVIADLGVSVFGINNRGQGQQAKDRDSVESGCWGATEQKTGLSAATIRKSGQKHCLSYPRHEYGASDEQEHAVSERQGWTKGRPE